MVPHSSFLRDQEQDHAQIVVKALIRHQGDKVTVISVVVVIIKIALDKTHASNVPTGKQHGPLLERKTSHLVLTVPLVKWKVVAVAHHV